MRKRRRWAWNRCIWACFQSFITILLVAGGAHALSSPQHLTIHNQRCLLVPASRETTHTAPPLLILPGLAQSIASYEALHVMPLSRAYPGPILVYEPLGFGPTRADCLLYDNDDVTFPIQVEHLLSVLDSNEVCQQLVDTNNNAAWNVVGYSWGARLAMALSTVCPERIHKLHLTGVALNRSPAGHVALQAWRDVLLLRDDELSNNKLRAFAWMALQTTYSSEFLYQQRDKLESWVQFLVDNNSVSGLGALLEQTYPADCNDPWHVESMAKRIQQQNGDKQISGCLLVGDEDVMAPVESARELAAILSWSLHTVESCGHAVPLQKPREWRQHVLEFLS